MPRDRMRLEIHPRQSPEWPRTAEPTAEAPIAGLAEVVTDFRGRFCLRLSHTDDFSHRWPGTIEKDREHCSGTSRECN